MTRKWICSRCHSLLGIFRDQNLEIRHKAAVYTVTKPESAETVCRRCGERMKAKPV